MIALLLLACTSHPSATESRALLAPPEGGTTSGVDTGEHASDTDRDTDRDTDSGTTSTPGGVQLSTESFRCAPGDYLDVDLPIPQSAVIQSYLLVDEGDGRFVWMLATDGVVIWDEAGADLFCSWTPGPAGAGVFWDGLSSQVVAVRVVWAAQG